MPWGDSFVSGFSAGSDAREKKKRREQDAQFADAKRELELDMQARQIAAQKQLQEARQAFEGGEADKGRTFTGGENDKGRAFAAGESAAGRTFTGGENDKGRTFTGAQSELDRAARSMALDKELAQRAQLAAAEGAFKEKQLGWTENPNNPTNAYYGALTKNMTPPDLDTPPQMTEADKQALVWAKSNPNDPRAAAIIKKLTGR